MTAALSALMRGSERRTEEVERVSRALAELRETAESPDGYVEVTVDARGRLCGLRLDPRVYRADTATLATAIITAVSEAAGYVEQRVAKVMRPLLPSQSTDPAGDLVLAELDRMRR